MARKRSIRLPLDVQDGSQPRFPVAYKRRLRAPREEGLRLSG